MNLNEFLKVVVSKNISDVHFKPDTPPIVRVAGKLVRMDFAFTQKMMDEFLSTVLNDQEKRTLFENKEIDLSYTLDQTVRYRVNVYFERNRPNIVMRVIPLAQKSFAELNLPFAAMEKIAKLERGLILISGITGAGKTTTMNSVINYMNNSFTYKIIMIEDPIEHYHKDIKSSISQREVGKDTKSFDNAMKFVMRQDPDVIVLGELRDKESIYGAIACAETGHLVLSTIHTIDAMGTIDRIIDMYPDNLKNQARKQISHTLQAVISQRLLPSKDQKERFPACEILLNTPAVKKAISEGRNADIFKSIEQGEFYGMKTMDQDITRLVSEGKITKEVARENATNPDDMDLKLKGIGA